MTPGDAARESPPIWCETCARLAPMDEWVRKLRRTRVVVGTDVLGFVSTFEHRACRAFTAIPVKGG